MYIIVTDFYSNFEILTIKVLNPDIYCLWNTKIPSKLFGPMHLLRSAVTTGSISINLILELSQWGHAMYIALNMYKKYRSINTCLCLCAS